MSRSSVVLPQPEGPSSVNSSPSPTSTVAWSTATVAPKRLTMPESPIFKCRSRLLPGRLDVLAEALLELVAALLGHVLVVDVGHGAVEVRANASGELDGHLDLRARRPLHAELGADREEPALHEHLLAPLGQQELDERARGLGMPGPGQDRHRLRRHERVLRRYELDVEARDLLLEGHVR